MVEIQLANGNRARVQCGKWICDNADDQWSIDMALDGRTFDPGNPSIPDADRGAAEAVIAKLGGRIVRADRPPRTVPGRIY